MNKRWYITAAAVAVGSLLLAACGSSSGGSSSSSSTTASAASGKVEVGVILPDTKSSARWANNDAPYLTKAFAAAGVKADIQNAQGSVSQFQTIADGMINEGVKVLMITNLDSASGTAVIKKAQAQGIKVIDYDRLTLGGGANYYVSFDNVAVGTAIGNGLVKCLKADNVASGAGVVELNGSPTDNNATLFKAGYDKVIKAAGYKVLTSQAVPNWDNTQAGTIFEQIFTKYGNQIKGVASANDGLAGAVSSVLTRNGLQTKVPITGQDATDVGLQRVLLGEQCVTVYKSIKLEAGKAAALAVDLVKGNTASASAEATAEATDTVAKTQVKSVLLTPQPIYQDNVDVVVKDGFTTAANLCTTSALKTACSKYGVS